MAADAVDDDVEVVEDVDVADRSMGEGKEAETTEESGWSGRGCWYDQTKLGTRRRRSCFGGEVNSDEVEGLLGLTKKNGFVGT